MQDTATDEKGGGIPSKGLVALEKLSQVQVRIDILPIVCIHVCGPP
jgi:hypothetical protein